MLNQISKLNSFVVPQAPSSSSMAAHLPCCKTTDTDPAACLQSAVGQRLRGQVSCSSKTQKVNSPFKKTAAKCPAKRLGASCSTVFKQ
jgi:hypothetical protein